MCSQQHAHETFLIKKDYLNEDGNLKGDVIGSLVGSIEGTQPTSEFYVYCILLDTRPNSPTSSSSSFFRQLCVTAAGKILDNNDGVLQYNWDDNMIYFPYFPERASSSSISIKFLNQLLVVAAGE
ncbi:unnamed protein product [Adineta steineri]|uniref:Uncharacterized protein n=1 Tax=Adineta steineri TaxID=433720 RepID=A0A813RJY5_9BILA|nr:unnamed protein product [Adineta steineri]CAF0785729.1 unnamed protein product [Adineta steineri]